MLQCNVSTCGCSSVVERQLPMLNVVGSSPISRFGKGFIDERRLHHGSFLLMNVAGKVRLAVVDY